MQKVKSITIMVLMVILLSGASIFVIYMTHLNKVSGTAEERTEEYTTFELYTKEQLFKTIPLLETKSGKVGGVYEYGQGSFTLNISGTNMQEYEEYILLLQKNGFKKHSDNGAEGMNNYVYTASFTKDKLVITVYHIARLESTYINASQETALSEYLINDTSYTKDIQVGAKTKLHMPELNDNGNSFIIQLKNGHFVVEDGGREADAPYLLDYLEKLTPDGEKPVIEAWFITHAHDDHSGAMRKIISDPQQAARVIVDGIYYVDLSNDIQQDLVEDVATGVWFVKNAGNAFLNQDGKSAKFYRPSLGQRYYFCDISIDIALTLDQLTQDGLYGVDFNDTSTWLMHNIEGQRFLHAGDAAETGIHTVMDLYDKEYFELDVFSVLHHGINVYNYFTDYCTLKTILYTSRNVGSLYTATWAARLEENEYLKKAAKESLSPGTGTLVLTFPYTIGSFEREKPLDWKYTDGIRDGRIWDVSGGRKE